MKLFNIVFKDGSTAEEYGDSVADVQQFVDRCMADRGAVHSIIEQI